MANINGQWIDRPERTERIRLMTERLRKLAAAARAGTATDYHLDLMRRDSVELAKLKRVQRSETDMLYFFYEYFSEARNAGNPDNLVPIGADLDTAPDFHARLSRILDSVSNHNTTARVAWAASRGHAKSAYLSNAFPVREIVFGKRRMILIISETNAGSKKFIRWVASQLKYNDKLREDFGEFLYAQKSRNEKDSEEAFLTTNNIKMEATSLGTQIRGFRNGSQRPDLILLDDLESLESNNTPELRQKAKDWLNSDLMPAGDPEKTAVIFMGTLVHYDSLLSYVLNERKDFIKNSFPAILAQPNRTDLWAEFERIYKEYEPLDDEMDEMLADESEVTETPNARAAMNFYRSNRAAMDEGAEVLWENRFPLPALMLEKVNFGTKSFNTEYMNNPIDEDSQIFNPENFYYYDPSREFKHSEYYFAMGMDFAMGKTRGDYSALITVAKHKATGKAYIIDAYVERVHPDAFLDEIIKRVAHYQPDVIGAEAQMAQEFFVDTLKAALNEVGYPAHSRVKKIQQRTRKELRIEAMLPDIERGDIVFNRSHTRLLEHFERYGSNWHDDAPDALAMALSSVKQPRAAIQVKPNYL